MLMKKTCIDLIQRNRQTKEYTNQREIYILSGSFSLGYFLKESVNLRNIFITVPVKK